jgi:hypothetical protein
VTGPRQPWVTPPGHPLTDEALKILFDQQEQRAQAREERFKTFLVFLPLLWGAVSVVLWMLYFAIRAYNST